MKFLPYQTYNKVNAILYSELPSHWSELKTKYLLKYQKGRNPDELFLESENNKIYLSMDFLRGNPERIFYVNDFSDLVIVGDNEILLLWDGANAGEFIRSKEGVLSSTMAVLKFYSLNQEFAWHLLKSIEPVLRAFTIGMGIPHVNSEFFSNILLGIPPPEEQRSIAAFLDYKTAQIDNLIEKKEQLLKLFEEKRIALITQAVTGHISPLLGEPVPNLFREDKGVGYKESNIPYIGKIPNHWELKRLKYLADIRFSGVDKKSNENEIDVSLCNYNEVYKNDFIDNSFEFMKATATAKEIKNFLLKKDDVIATKDSETPYEIAIPALVIQDLDNVICGYHLAHIRPNQNQILGSFLFRLFQATNFNSQFIVQANGITRFGLGTDSFASALVPYPSLEEQLQIVNHLDKELSKLDKLAAKITEAIEKLKEYRTTLITAAVTGKIDVRNFQPPSPLRHSELVEERRGTEACTEQSRSGEVL